MEFSLGLAFQILFCTDVQILRLSQQKDDAAPQRANWEPVLKETNVEMQ
jgi:hypothetical protein